MENKVFEHLMVDLETMGNQSFSSILSIAAVEFDINTGETGNHFYQNISLSSNMLMGLNPNPDTIMWWLQQNEQARMELVNSKKISIAHALQEFSAFCNKNYQIWGNSARFDLGLLQDAYNKNSLDIPWDFRKERCLRTLVSFNPKIKENFVSTGIAHNALSDCMDQIKYCSDTWNDLKRNQ